MSDFDLAIAAHAIAFGLIVVTADAAFGRLGIRRESWHG
jgi:predicted nucleic acid-binding protein